MAARPGTFIVIGAIVVAGAACAESFDAAPALSRFDYCTDEARLWERCSPTLPERCREDLEAQCSSREAMVSVAFIDAFHMCELDCEKGTRAQCVEDALERSTPTEAHEKLAEAFCRGCSRTGHVRKEGLACAGQVVGGTGRLLGQEILRLSDKTADVVASKCIEPAVAAYPTDYLNCENEFLNCISAQLPPSPQSCPR